AGRLPHSAPLRLTLCQPFVIMQLRFRPPLTCARQQTLPAEGAKLLTGSPALAAGIIPVMMGATYVGPGFAMTQGLVPLRMRAQSVAILLFVLNMIGLGL